MAERIAPWLFALLAVGSAPATALEYAFDQNSGRLEFEGEYDGEAVTGVFRRFTGRATLEPSATRGLRLETTIEVASLDTDYPDRDEVLRNPDWFDAERYPKADWRSEGPCTPKPPALRCPGLLTLRGVTHPVPLVLSFDPERRRLQGGAEFDRRVFGVGGGEWERMASIGAEVRIRFTLELRPEP